MRRSRCLLAVLIGALLSAHANAQAKLSAEQRTARYMESVRKQPPILLPFLREMPKGGDLHNHLAGAIYAESWIDFAADDGLCVDRTTARLIAPPCDSSCEKYTNKPAVRCAYGDQVLYNTMVDAWSMRNWKEGEESAHDHLFAAFEKFSLALTIMSAMRSPTQLRRQPRIISSFLNSCTLQMACRRPFLELRSDGMITWTSCATNSLLAG